MKIGGEDRNLVGSERLTGEEFPQRNCQFGHEGERLSALYLMREDRPRSGTQAERNFPPIRELGDRREGHGKIDRVTKVGNRDGGPELDRQPRYDRRRACQHAAIFKIVVGPNLTKAKFSQRLPSALSEPDQFRESVTIEDMEGIMYADFTGKMFCLFGHSAPASTAR
jgi:hypothetical protein